MTAVRSALGDGFDAAWAAGADLDLDAAVELAVVLSANPLTIAASESEDTQGTFLSTGPSDRSAAPGLSVTAAGCQARWCYLGLYTQLAPPLLHSPRVAPGLSLIGRRALVARSLTETLDEAAPAAAQASDWERDQEAWNLHEPQEEP